MITLADAIPSVARVLQMTETDERVIDTINEAQQRLLNHQGISSWWNVARSLQITVDSTGAITWPRSVAAVDSIAICQQPIPMRNRWYEFLLGYGGLRPENCPVCGGVSALDRGPAVTITDIIPTGKQIKATWRLSNDSSKKLLCKGLDDNGERIYTEYPVASGTYIEGFYLTCPAAPPLSSTSTVTNYVSSLQFILKDETSGFVDLYERDATAGTDRLIGTYEPGETHISYRRTLIDRVSLAQTNCADCTDNSKVVNALVKRAFVPAVVDTDELVIGNLRALKLACMSIAKEEKNLFDEAENYFAGRLNTVTGNREGGAIGELVAEQRTMNNNIVSIGCKAHGTAELSNQRIGMLM